MPVPLSELLIDASNACILPNRCSVPEELLTDCQDDSEASVPRLRPHLPPALQRGRLAARRGAPQHQLQTLRLLRAGEAHQLQTLRLLWTRKLYVRGGGGGQGTRRA